MAPETAAARVEPTPLDGEVRGLADELLVFVVEAVEQVKGSRSDDIQNVIQPLLQEPTLRRGGTREHVIKYRYLIRKGRHTTDAKQYKNVPPLRVELYKNRERVVMRVPHGEGLALELKQQIVDFFKPKLIGYDVTQSMVSYPTKKRAHFEADAMKDKFAGDFGADGSHINIKGTGRFGPDGMPLTDGEHSMRYGPDGFLEPIIDVRPRHGYAFQRGWYRAESGRLEVEDTAVRRFHLICNVVDLLKKTGRIQSGKWTNDPETFPDDLLRGEVLPFPPNDKQRYVPTEFCDEAGETIVYISGATGNNSDVINGEYLLRSTYDGKPLYEKQDHESTNLEDNANKWLRYVKARESWMVSETKDMYFSNAVGWCCSIDRGHDEPMKVKRWSVMNGSKWEEQELRVVKLASTEARIKRRLPDRTLDFEKKKATWGRIGAYAMFPAYECRLFPIAQGKLNFGTANIDGIHMGRVLQGGLKNAYFVEALNALSLRPALVRRLFFAYDCGKSVYSVRLFKNGVWISVEVDDFVPNGNSKALPLCCRHEHFPAVLWPSMVEKAYAKACTARSKDSDTDSGGWEALGGGGRVEEALVDLTGGVGGAFSTKDVSADRLFVYLHEMQRYCLWVCRVNIHASTVNGVDFNPYANYAVNRAVHFQGECFVQLRCVDERRRHPDVGLEKVLPWDAHPELLKTYPGKGSEGFMWLTINDFHLYFDAMFECRLVNSPDVGIAGMPPPKLPVAKMFPDSDWVKWATDNVREHEDWFSSLNEDVDLSYLFDPQKRLSGELSGELLPVNGVVPGTKGAGKGMPGGAPFDGAFATGAGHAWEALTDKSSIFYEHIFATEGSVTSHKPPQLTVTLPEAPCEIVVSCEQVDNRLFQVGSKRKQYEAILMKVYQSVERTGVDHGQVSLYSQELVCKSEWAPTRGSMVAWRCRDGGEFKVLCGLKAGRAVERLVIRVYSSVPYVDAHASQSLRQEKLVEDKEPPRGIKCTLVGSVVPERLFRVDQPEPLAEDLDELRESHQKDKQWACPAM